MKCEEPHGPPSRIPSLRRRSRGRAAGVALDAQEAAKEAGRARSLLVAREQDGFATTSIEDRRALRDNVRAFTGRLREVGFYRDLSDAYVTQTITPRYRIAADNTAAGGQRWGSTLALFRIDEEIAAELLAKATPFGGPRTEGSPEPAVGRVGPVDPAGESEVIADVETKAQSFVEDRLARLDERQMPEIIAAILRAMGYKTRVSEAGPDRGVDIFASPDGLGLQEPRIFVEVKHRRGAMGSKEIRAFLGGRKAGDRCLYVSTGGFTRDAKYEADRSSTPLTLLTLPQLRELLLDHYEKLDSDARALIPLRRVYLPVPE